MTLAPPARTLSDSWLARRDGRWRLAAFLVVVTSAAGVSTPAGAAWLVLPALVGVRLARVPARDLAARLGLLALSLLPLLASGWWLGPGGSPTAVALRVVAVGVAGLALARAAPLADTFVAARALGCPRVLCEVARAADRHSVLFAGEFRRTRLALRTRGFAFGTTRHGYRTLAHSLAALFARADDRAGRVAAAMRTRGYRGVTRATARPRTGPGDLALVAGSLVAAAVALWLDRAGP